MMRLAYEPETYAKISASCARPFAMPAKKAAPFRVERNGSRFVPFGVPHISGILRDVVRRQSPCSLNRNPELSEQRARSRNGCGSFDRRRADRRASTSGTSKIASAAEGEPANAIAALCGALPSWSAAIARPGVASTILPSRSTMTRDRCGDPDRAMIFGQKSQAPYSGSVALGWPVAQ
jgi:hypothetical protein